MGRIFGEALLDSEVPLLGEAVLNVALDRRYRRVWRDGDEGGTDPEEHARTSEERGGHHLPPGVPKVQRDTYQRLLSDLASCGQDQKYNLGPAMPARFNAIARPGGGGI